MNCPKQLPRRVRRFMIIYAILVILTWALWKLYIQPYWEEENAIERSLNAQLQDVSVIGASRKPEFNDLKQMDTLDPSLLPSAQATNRRLIFVGDVHGCKKELEHLLKKVSFDNSFDHLVLTGDIVSKGPSSRGVIKLARSLSASCVRGNHEDRVLLAYSSLRPQLEDVPKDKENPFRPDDDELEELNAHRKDPDLAVARSLSREQVAWLQQCPVILRVGPLTGWAYEAVVVHAGLVPGVPYERQDPFHVMNMRSIDAETLLAYEDRKRGVAWEKLWNRYQSRKSIAQTTTVIYGHDSKRGLNLKKHSKGLDSGCVKGGRLTALVLSWDELKGAVQEEVVSVRCTS